MRRRSGARANLPRVSFPDARAGTSVSTCTPDGRLRFNLARRLWVRSSPVGSGSFREYAHALLAHLSNKKRVVQPRLSIDDGVGRFRPMVRPTTLRVGGGWGVVGVIVGTSFVSFVVGTSARVVDPSIHRSSRAARLTNTLVRSRALWDLSRPLSSSARGTRAPPRVEACVPAGVWKRGSCRPRVPPRTRPRAGRRPRTPGP